MTLRTQFRFEDLQEKPELTPAELVEYISLCEQKEEEDRRLRVDWFEVM